MENSKKGKTIWSRFLLMMWNQEQLVQHIYNYSSLYFYQLGPSFYNNLFSCLVILVIITFYCSTMICLQGCIQWSYWVKIIKMYQGFLFFLNNFFQKMFFLIFCHRDIKRIMYINTKHINTCDIKKKKTNLF